ncbi:acyltransferase [Rhizobium sp. AN80A]|uniref:acyltransferase family protein n=1 Tax=Rhizobium sp. AN80A TaxID=3040673 RepID=UPI000DDB52F6|nr:acyltransferase [Rhizobium sp. AN80A]
MQSLIKTQWLRLRGEIERGDSKGHRYEGLDILRGVAALAVLFKHFHSRLDLPYLAPNGYLAVDFFFVLSGFVIANAYGKQLEDGTLSTGTFFWKRWIRLMPLIVVGMMISVIAQLGRPDPDQTRHLSDVAIALIFGLSLMPILQTSFFKTPTLEQSVFPLNTPMWSLFFEVFANIAFAVYTRLRLPPWSLLVIVVVSGLWLLIGISSRGDVNFGFNTSGFWFGFPRVIWSFSIGMLIYRYRSFAPRNMFFPAMVVLVAILLTPTLGLSRVAADMIIVMIIMPAIVFACLNADLGSRARLCATWGGNLSYPLYALHYPIVQVLGYVAKAQNLPWIMQAGVVIGGTAFLVGLSAVVYTMVDVPLRRRISMLVRRA